MQELDLGESAVTDPATWRLAALGTVAALAKLWDGVQRLGFSPALAGLATLAALGGLLVARGLRRRAALLPQQRLLYRSTLLFGHPLSEQTLDLSASAWVRARLVGGYHTPVVVEVGRGEDGPTTELIRVSSEGGRGIARAQRLCEHIAAQLQIPSEGYKALA